MRRLLSGALAMLGIELVGLAATLVFNCGQQLALAYFCPTYFTEGLVDIYHTTNLLILGLGWGVVGSWWVGAPLGLVFALVAVVGPWPRLTAGQVLRLAAFLVLGLWLASLVIGTTGYVVARAYSGDHVLWLARWLPLDWAPYLNDAPTWWRFTAASWADTTAYYTGIAGAVLVCGVALVQRRGRRRSEGARPAPPAVSAAGEVSA